ncbi:MarR family transcriptional regulator [Clostridiaceae bacterium M8S5]|nr:MarR family transcriptional regulator [Clostridiaceae bacterium M8S5]
MNNYYKILEQMARIQYRIGRNDKKPRKFGTNQLMYQSEIHFIDAIGCNEQIKPSELSNKLGITYGAITQIATKLIKKKLIEKYKIKNNKKEVYYKLTESGKVAYENHRLFHQELNDKIVSYLKDLSKDEIQVLLGLLDIADKYIPEL